MKMTKIGSGLVHDTYIAKDEKEDYPLIFQRLNTFAFSDPEALMENAVKITAFLSARKIPTLEFLPFEDGQYLKKDETGVWRKMKYVDSVTYDTSADPTIIAGTASAFGSFGKNLSDFHERLNDTIKDFHNTKKRLDDCLAAAEKNEFGRSDEARDLISLIEKNAVDIRTDFDMLFSCGPLRVTHNDTKMNNVLFDRNTKKPILVADLDTVMYGLSLFDFADGARSVSLESKGKDKLVFNKGKYEMYKNAYLKASEGMLTRDEKDNLFLSVLTISKELGMRFLEDYLKGDPYFRITEEKDNYYRAKRMLEFAFQKDIR